MHDTDADETSAVDPLAEIVRAAGRRAAPPRAHYDQVYAAAHATWRKKLRQRRRRNWYALAAAVAVVAVSATLWQTFLSTTQPVTARIALTEGRVERFSAELNGWIPADDANQALVEGSRIRTRNSASAALRLVDGGSLRLRANTDLALGDATFELTSGTLYFDSAGRRADMTIDIVTPFGTVRDVGTQFEVRTTPDTLRVRVRSGSITLVDSKSSEPVSGSAGEEIHLTAEGELSRRDFAQDDPEWSWTESLAVVPDFDTPSVLLYLTWIAQETGKTLEFESETVRLQAELARFLGDPEGLMPRELLITITATSDFSYEMTDHGSILISRDTRSE